MKKYDADVEAFAAMKRAFANGFAKHEPAYSVEELAAEARAKLKEDHTMSGADEKPQASRAPTLSEPFGATAPSNLVEKSDTIACARCGDLFCASDCDCACHAEEP